MSRTSNRIDLLHSLERLLRSGVSLPDALSSLVPHSRSGTAIRNAIDVLGSGGTVPDVFDALGFVGPDRALIEAGAHTARLPDTLCSMRCRIEDALRVRKKVLRACLYPALLLTLAPLLLSLPPSIMEGGGYIRRVIPFLLGFYGAGMLGFLSWKLAGKLYADNAVLAPLVGAIPFWGRLFELRSNERFAATAGLAIEAGLNVFTSLELAARASRSMPLIRRTEQAVGAVRRGASLDEEFGEQAGISRELSTAFRIGQRTGRLDEEMLRCARVLSEDFSSTIDLVAEWMPRLLYLGAVLITGWMIVSMALSIGQEFGDVLIQ